MISDQLKQIFCDNFLAYYKSHVAHVNITGRNFASDHALLDDIYSDLQEQIDRIAELLRTIGEMMPDNLQEVISYSHIIDIPVSGSADSLLDTVRDDLIHLKDCHEELISEAGTNPQYQPLSNYAQDRVLALNKFIWKLDSTLA